MIWAELTSRPFPARPGAGIPHYTTASGPSALTPGRYRQHRGWSGAGDLRYPLDSAARAFYRYTNIIV
jgi:hypothetical protein